MDDPSNKIVWLASYPKSGNTWFRAFITALLNDGEIDINNLKVDGIFSSRKLFYEATDIDSTMLYNDEANLLQPGAFTWLATKVPGERLFIKVHDAYTLNKQNLPIIPTEGTLVAVYIIRNPLDMAASLASHRDTGFDESVELLNNKQGVFSSQPDNMNTRIQLVQLLLDWSSHVTSWTSGLPFPVMVLRYEDMLADPLKTFSKAVKFLNIDADDVQIQKAIAASSFEQLQQKERQSGFGENYKGEVFFRSGKAGNWKNELSDQQINAIINHHKTVMEKYGY